MPLPKDQAERDKLLDQAIELMIDGHTTKETADMLSITRFDLWDLWHETDESQEKWNKAMELKADDLAEEGLEIVDNSDIASSSLSRVQSDYRKWYAAKLSRRYADKQELEVKGQIAVQPVISIGYNAPKQIEQVQVIDNKKINDK